MFELVLRGPKGTKRSLNYNPMTSACVWTDTGEPIAEVKTKAWKEVFPVSPQNPAGKTRKAKKVKIQLGLKCNYSCSYCNQRSQPQDMQANPKQVERFLAKLPSWLDLGSGEQVRIEFWGGEPFVYWRTLKPLAEGIRALYPKAEFTVITNASLLDQEKVDWLYALGFRVGISHDGPAYEAGRGADPLCNDEQRKWIKYLFDRMSPEGRLSFNAVLSLQNLSLDAVRAYIGKKLDVSKTSIVLSTEEVLLPYDEMAADLSLNLDSEAASVRDTVFMEAITGATADISSVVNKIEDFFRSVTEGRPAHALGQKCGMDREDNLALDLNGNVMTCQNTSALTKHRIGHMDAFDHIKLTTAHHWSVRAECVKCPVLQLCRGSCLFLEGELWEKACDNSFNYNLGLLAASLFIGTGLVLVEINGKEIRAPGIVSIPVIDADLFEIQIQKEFHA
ncbi:sulfatase_rSAM, anaerobic sulfatase maturase [uncultured Caudovirales phage]|uniref:Sulfatase_rSAM, anaerobic sulfatase maturase n=1 Tax=uncultured Caudovirales phage TaxID=2100421 RepID=A0A6J5KMA5_9CAUD|nr:sulfatase_rSAM, anaerobic sulfatase maturase [uncultured Caudovirales phage]CAB4123741.1 sulfatase_rSAM, anaerobic sulfatase maturase [uncultured Caudovirales phage]